MLSPEVLYDLKFFVINSYRSPRTLKVRCLSLKSFTFYLSSVYIFFFFIGTYHSVLYHELVEPPISTKTAYPVIPALQAEYSDTVFDDDDDFPKLQSVWDSLPFPANDRHSYTHPSHSFKSIEKFSLLPRSPPFKINFV